MTMDYMFHTRTKTFLFNNAQIIIIIKIIIGINARRKENE